VAGDLPPDAAGRSASPYLPLGAEIGAYRIETFLDRGGMAFVYEATDLRLNRRVALKVLAPELAESSEFRDRFLREGRMAASLDHPNIVPIYEAGEAAGLLYISMRYVRGSTLAALLRRDGALDPDRAVAILSRVADALDTAHAANLVHRDVKPANILLASTQGRPGHEHVYLSDFGLTRHASALVNLTVTGQFLGTLAYVSPEQIRAEPLDARSDLYALGSVAYECLTGVPPFVRDDQAALIWAQLNDRPAEVSDHRPELRAADPVLARALAKRRSDRFQTGQHFVAALGDALLAAPQRTATMATARHGTPTGTSPTHASPAERPAPVEPGAGSMTAALLRVFLVDDHEMVRRGVADLLDEEDDLTVVGQASSVAEGLIAVPAARPDVAVLDMRLPDGNGVELCRELRSRLPELNCLMLTSDTDEQAMIDAILAGAGGYVIKDIKSMELVAAVRTVGSGRSLLDARATSALMNRLRTGAGQPVHPLGALTDRERGVLDLIGQGLTNREIGERMALSEATVKRHVSQLLSKLGMHRRTQVAVLATELRDPGRHLRRW